MYILLADPRGKNAHPDGWAFLFTSLLGPNLSERLSEVSDAAETRLDASSYPPGIEARGE